MKGLIGAERLPSVSKRLRLNRVLADSMLGRLEFGLEKGLFQLKSRNVFVRSLARRRLHSLSRYTLAMLVLARTAIRLERELTLLSDPLSVDAFSQLLSEQFGEAWGSMEKRSFEWTGPALDHVGGVALKNWLPELRVLLAQHQSLQDELKGRWLLGRMENETRGLSVENAVGAVRDPVDTGLVGL